MKKKNKKLKKQNTTKKNNKRSTGFAKKQTQTKTHYEKEGILHGTGRGYMFFVPDDNSGDLFIAEDDLRGAMHGDRVIAKKISSHKGNGEGKVVKIIERTKSVFVAIARKGHCYPTEKGMPYSVSIIRENSVDYEEGDVVVARLLFDEPRFCYVTERLGKSGITDTDILAIIRSFALEETFPSYVMNEVASTPSVVTQNDLYERTDFRENTVITIDGAHSKDFDDAIEVVKKEDGYLLYVHIADVAHYVSANSKIDKEALKRGTSVYFADRVIPMLPEALSNGICSLNEGEDRLTLSVIMGFDNEGNRNSTKICEGVIRSKARMTYDEVNEILNGNETLCKKYAPIVEMLNNAKDLASILKENRINRGAVEFDLTETEFEFDKDKNVIGLHPLKRLISHSIIEEFMLSANEAVAYKFFKKGAPFVYRVHEAPPEEKVDALIEFLASLDIKFTKEPTGADYARLLSKTDENLVSVVSRVALRSMSKADYRPDCKGHFGLSAQYYCHFTSPIRRYPDLAIHRIIKSSLKGQTLSVYKDWVKTVSIKSSEREKVADEAERKVDDLLKAKFMKDKIGQEYDGIISGVTDRGLFVELENSVEGMVKVEYMRGYYVYNEKLLTLSCGLKCFRLGDKVRIRVEAIDVDKIAFALVE